MNTKEAYSEKC